MPEEHLTLHDILQVMHQGFGGINDRLDQLNGRTRQLEQAQAVHSVKIDRLETIPATRRLWLAPIVGAICGGGAGSVLTLALQHLWR